MEEKKDLRMVLKDVQHQLEQSKGTDTPMLFLSGEAGAIMGEEDALTALLMFNMVRYEAFRNIIVAAIRGYSSIPQSIKNDILKDKPTREIVEYKKVTRG